MVAATGVVLALGLSSCGSSSSGPLTRAEFARKANAVCLHRKAVNATIVAKVRGDIRAGARAALPELERSVKQLAELQPPPELRRDYATIVAAERHSIAIWRELLAGKTPQGNDVGSPLHHNEHLRVLLGMPACN